VAKRAPASKLNSASKSVNVDPLELIDQLTRADAHQLQQVVEGFGISKLVAACLPATRAALFKGVAEKHNQSLDGDGMRDLWRALSRDQQDRLSAIINTEIDAEQTASVPAH
jgi:hypothetical protein